MQTLCRASLTSETVCSSLQKNIHCPDIQQGEEGGQEGRKCKRKKKKSSLYFMTAKGISKTFLYSYNVLFCYNVISLNINLPGPNSLLLE